MRKTVASCALAPVLVAGAISAPAIHAQENHESAGPMMNWNVMGMGMMNQMGRMMDHCDGMWSRSRPNVQWRKNKPSAPEKNG